MKSSIKKLPDSYVELTCLVEPQEFNPFISGALKTIGQEVEVQGFRKGKVPEAILKERLGLMKIYEEAARQAISHFYAQCANQHQIDPIGRPVVTVQKLAPDNPFEFTIKVAVFPEVKLPDYTPLLKPLAQERRLPVVTEEMVNDSLNWLRKSRASQVSREDKSQAADNVIIDFSMTDQGVLLDQGEQKNFVVRLGQHQVVPGLEEKLQGVAKGDQLEFDLEIPGDYWNKAIAGKTVHFLVKVKEVMIEILPEINDAFVQSLGKFKTLAELRDSIRQGLELEEQEKERQRFRLRLLKEINNQTVCYVPEVLINSELETLMASVRDSIEVTGIAWPEYLRQISKTEEAMHQELLPQAKERVRLALIIEAIAQKQKIQASDEEVEAEANKYLVKYRSLAKAGQDIDSQKLIAQTRDILKNEKVSQYLESLAASL